MVYCTMFVSIFLIYTENENKYYENETNMFNIDDKKDFT